MVSYRSPFFITILLLYLVAGTLYATLTPNWQAPDEPAHYNYIRYLATQQRFPELVDACYDQAYLTELTTRRFSPELPVDNVCYEFHQPPLYYLLQTPIYWLSQGSLLALRLTSVLLGAGVVILAFLISKTIKPDHPAIVYGTMAFVAFVPMHLTMLSSVNNDALAEFILAILLLLLIRRLNAGQTKKLNQDIQIGIILGLGLVTKMTVYIAIPLVAATLWLTPLDSPQRDWPILIKEAGLIYGIALLIAAPWFIRNAVLYGSLDIFGLARHDEIVVGQLRTAELLGTLGWGGYLNSFIVTTFRSFWGQFGWMAVPMDGRTYLLLLLFITLAIFGLFGLWLKPPELSQIQRRSLLVLALTACLMTLGYIYYNITFVQFQGRYLFPALIPFGFLVSLGLSEILDKQWRWGLAIGLSLVLVGLGFNGILTESLDKWALLIVGLAVGLVGTRALLADRWLIPTAWMMGICYAGLILLALFAPFWFIVPYLTP